jgi:hypothetical protein
MRWRSYACFGPAPRYPWSSVAPVARRRASAAPLAASHTPFQTRWRLGPVDAVGGPGRGAGGYGHKSRRLCAICSSGTRKASARRWSGRRPGGDDDRRLWLESLKHADGIRTVAVGPEHEGVLDGVASAMPGGSAARSRRRHRCACRASRHGWLCAGVDAVARKAGRSDDRPGGDSAARAVRRGRPRQRALQGSARPLPAGASRLLRCGWSVRSWQSKRSGPAAEWRSGRGPDGVRRRRRRVPRRRRRQALRTASRRWPDRWSGWGC